MSQLLKKDEVVFTETSRAPCAIKALLGEGGQGEVYRAELGGTDVAVKWYFPHYLEQDPGLHARLSRAIEWGQPTDRFLWPHEIVSAPNTKTFGYLMPLREPRFVGLNQLLAGELDVSFRAVTTAAFELADSYQHLHAKGLCYKDINFGNVSFDPATGEVRICDNDNVAVTGDPSGLTVGTQGFMAPEVERGEAPTTTQTDLHSLAVLLFSMHVMHHPLSGVRVCRIECLDQEAKRAVYGEKPLFIFDPKDPSNAPLPGVQDAPLAYWPLYPGFVRDLFTKAFTVGLHQPAARVTEFEWKEALVRLRDSIYYCAGCGRENFADFGRRGLGPKPRSCWGCKLPVSHPPHILFADETLMLNHDSVLYPHHLDPNRRYDFSRPLGVVVKHPRDGRRGIKNVSQQKWIATLDSGDVSEILPGKVMLLNVPVRVHFGQTEGHLQFS